MIILTEQDCAPIRERKPTAAILRKPIAMRQVNTAAITTKKPAVRAISGQNKGWLAQIERTAP